MEDRTKTQITIGLLAFFASMWVLLDHTIKTSTVLLDGILIIIALLVIMLVLSYVIISILEWIKIFDLKTNAILTLIVLTTFMITFTVYILTNFTF
jgi:hypothetical protein